MHITETAANENISTVSYESLLISNDWMKIMLHGYVLLKIKKIWAYFDASVLLQINYMCHLCQIKSQALNHIF